MIKIKKILVPTDFSSGAEKAYTVAQKIAAAFDSRIDFIHVIPTVKYLGDSLKTVGLPLSIEKEIFPKVIDEAEHQLERGMKAYLKEKYKGEAIVKIDRKPSQTISAHAEEEGYDLIVMGARGKHESGMFRGTTTEKVIRSSKVPVFTVDDIMDENQINNILVPIDGSEVSMSAFPMSVQLADIFDSELTMIHVLELYGSIADSLPREVDRSEYENIYEGLISRLQAYLRNNGISSIELRRSGSSFRDYVVLKDDHSSRMIPLYFKIERGVSAHFEIESYAEEAADMVVMATHGRSGLSHLLLGSTAEKVAQYCKKPIITIKPDTVFLDRGPDTAADNERGPDSEGAKGQQRRYTP